MGNGAISLELSILMAIWLIRGPVTSGIWMQPNRFFSKPSQWLALLQSTLQRMGTVPIHVQYENHWEMR
jgi:hypothetical protein